ncbi:ABC transporter permease subunit [Mycolicibacterium psychrotolerans]|uniref:ABC transmembrane type-1 domain-containing protein n=1 Tax=Mycolicibacterium psychrotolerans TaxID=216929 RepID=A0A7I7MGW4_9MYCO|nr:ABC transporter permease subunit [Mycolicibacterium psychrotolerans]BBX71584.1 hypothetical protein MPSYJ_50450 [Mycolicibacterium psychrotolerans]
MLFPANPRFANYTEAWAQAPFRHFFLNSLTVTAVIGALMLPNLATAFGIFFLRQFFQTVPVELEEAARVDGTSRLGVLFKIVLSLSLPAMSTLAALTVLKSWTTSCGR